ncbi:hypothetical protein [Algoriphagus halophytocola]|uniref:SH3 domain-containing protein n=1 Tax=Algoriphagus halophytocola TaxID=2991499 RepID=A0ABY6MEV8_9BACT|nr:hypothetical protein [Algoriphagus sp. TR-M5]UZD21166.1 hypothetical protein OM944_10820 [Algoriphagus sp. TR-M5]
MIARRNIFYFIITFLISTTSLFSQVMEKRSFTSGLSSEKVSKSGISRYVDDSPFLKFKNEIIWEIPSDFFSGKIIQMRVYLLDSPTRHPKIIGELKGGDVVLILDKQYDIIAGNMFRVARYSLDGWVYERDLELSENYFEFDMVLDNAKKIEFVYLDEIQIFDLKESISKYFTDKYHDQVNLVKQLDSLKRLQDSKISSLKKKKDIQQQLLSNSAEFEQFHDQKKEKFLQKYNSEKGILNSEIERVVKVSHLNGNRVRKEEREISDSIFSAELKKKQALDSIALIQSELDQRRKEQEQLRIIEGRKAEIISKYGQQDGNRIIDRKVWIGMSEDMLLESWGKPRRVNTTTTKYGIKKQYVYFERYVYLDNGIVESIQATEN